MVEIIDDTNLAHFDESAPIRASELAQFSYCQRAWWLSAVRKLPAENEAELKRGRAAHVRHERQVRRMASWRRAGFTLVAVGGVFLLIALIWFVAGGGA